MVVGVLVIFYYQNKCFRTSFGFENVKADSATTLCFHISPRRHRHPTLIEPSLDTQIFEILSLYSQKPPGVDTESRKFTSQNIITRALRRKNEAESTKISLLLKIIYVFQFQAMLEIICLFSNFPSAYNMLFPKIRFLLCYYWFLFLFY